MPPPDPEKLRAWRRRSKRIKPKSDRRRAEGPGNVAVVAAVFERDQGCILRRLDPEHRCFGDLTPHRLRKGSAGGGYTMSNTVALCAFGNGQVEDRPAWARSLGLVVR